MVRKKTQREGEGKSKGGGTGKKNLKEGEGEPKTGTHGGEKLGFQRIIRLGSRAEVTESE